MILQQIIVQLCSKGIWFEMSATLQTYFYLSYFFKPKIVEKITWLAFYSVETAIVIDRYH